MKSVILSALIILTATSAFAGNIPVPQERPTKVNLPASAPKAPASHQKFVRAIGFNGQLYSYRLNGTESEEQVNAIGRIMRAYLSGQIHEIVLKDDSNVTDQFSSMGFPVTYYFRDTRDSAQMVKALGGLNLEQIGLLSDD